MPASLVLKILAAVAMALPAVALGIFALPHLRDGVALDAAIPVPNYMLLQLHMPNDAYRRAAAALAHADRRDGDAEIAAAEALVHAGAAPATQIWRLRQGISDAPVTPRGWVLLSHALLPTDRNAAAAALSQALLLAPSDYWVSILRSQEAAAQWDSLDADSRAMALRQVQLLWDSENLRVIIPALLASPGGLDIVSRAFAGRASDLRALNRWVSRQRRRRAKAS